MRFLILVKASADSEAGGMPQEARVAEMGDYHEALAEARTPTPRSKCVNCSSPKTLNLSWRSPVAARWTPRTCSPRRCERHHSEPLSTP